MCSIMGCCSEAADYALFKRGFDKTVSRGPDDSRIVDTGKGLLGFHRLAIMGLRPEGMQPFALDGSYVAVSYTHLIYTLLATAVSVMIVAGLELQRTTS